MGRIIVIEGNLVFRDHVCGMLEKAGYTAAFPGLCMHEFVLTLEELKKEEAAL